MKTLLAIAMLSCSLANAASTVTLDTNRWMIESDEGSKASLKFTKDGILLDYSLGQGGWTQIYHPFVEPVLFDDSTVITFGFKWTGKRNHLEVKIVDVNDSTFGKRFDLEARKDEWQEIKIPLKEFTYWWGVKEAPLDKNIKSFWIAVSKIESGSGKFWIRDLEIGAEQEQARRE